MAIPTGTEVYNVAAFPVVACGVVYTESEVDQVIAGGVIDILCDTTGTKEVAAMLSGFSDSTFADTAIKSILNREISPEDWRVGEAIAEQFLQDHRDCQFPWPTSRDLKNPSASPAGTDIVGFQKTNDTDYRFAFGEVKTSFEKKSPPSVMTSSHGMVKQIKDLINGTDVKSNLLEYLGHRANNSPWKDKYRCAAIRYLNDPDDVSIYGILIRDVQPEKKDIINGAKVIAKDCRKPTSMELRAMYFPHGAIDPEGAAESLSDRVKNNMEGDET